jgi:dTDP-4-amino-4,6-dideoxygalactose transaminase
MMIDHSKPALNCQDLSAISEPLHSGEIAQGRKVAQFEENIARFIGAKKAGVAVSSGTAALHLALKALNVGKGDEVILPSYVCAVLLNAVNYEGAQPILAEIHPDSFNMDIHAVKKVLTNKTKTIILPHLFGLPADIKEFLALGIPLIEDCAQALGATYQGKMAGNFGTFSIFSFYATKLMTTGEGGMIFSESQTLLDEVRDLRDYDKKDDYRVRYNYKLTDLQAALGLSQLNRLPAFLSRRREIAQRYTEAMQDFPADLPKDYPDRDHIYYRYVMKIENRKAHAANGKLERCLHLLHVMGVGCQKPVYRPLHNYLGLKGFPITDKIWNNALSLPIYPSLQDDEVEEIIKKVGEVLGKRE